MKASQNLKVTWQSVPTRTITAGGVETVTALQAQLKALRRWGSKAPADLSKIHQPVLVANGDRDRMVPSANTHDLARRLPNSDLIIYPDSGHGAVFQFHADFVPKALEFLAR
jgi:pimeloyl-ACP methyl ester carboxylesterase